jgi:hypothetical protein
MTAAFGQPELRFRGGFVEGGEGECGAKLHRASMHEMRLRAETLVEANGEGGENRGRVGASAASERLVHMFEAAPNRDPVAGQERQLRRAMRKLFQCGEAVDRRDFADGVHLGVDIERRKAGGALAELCDPLAELLPDVAERP